jgi:hypothetical protein
MRTAPFQLNLVKRPLHLGIEIMIIESDHLRSHGEHAWLPTIGLPANIATVTPVKARIQKQPASLPRRCDPEQAEREPSDPCGDFRTRRSLL